MKKNLLNHFITAFLLILTWVVLVRNYYGYNHDYPVLLGINLLPLLAGTFGLFGVYLIYSYAVKLIKPKYFSINFLIFIFISLVVVLAIETFGYHVLNIKNDSMATYTGLPICNCIHAPYWMQLAYLSMGSIYFMICNLLGLENNSKKTIA